MPWPETEDLELAAASPLYVDEDGLLDVPEVSVSGQPGRIGAMHDRNSCHTNILIATDDLLLQCTARLSDYRQQHHGEAYWQHASKRPWWHLIDMLDMRIERA